MATQCDLILMHMKKYGSITHMEAEREYGIARLASRINDLRRQGVASRVKSSPVRTGVMRQHTLLGIALRRVRNED